MLFSFLPQRLDLLKKDSTIATRLPFLINKMQINDILRQTEINASTDLLN